MKRGCWNCFLDAEVVDLPQSSRLNMWLCCCWNLRQKYLNTNRSSLEEACTHRQTHTLRSVKACSVALSSLSWSQSGSTVRPAINSQAISYSPQGSQQHWAGTRLTMCICVYKCLYDFCLETHDPNPRKNYRAVFGQKHQVGRRSHTGVQ